MSTSFVILGYPRSGTTALAALANSHPQVLCLSFEGNVLYRLFRVLSRHGSHLPARREDMFTELQTMVQYNFLDRVPKNFTKSLPGVQQLYQRLRATLEESFQQEKLIPEIYSRCAAMFFEVLAEAGSYSVVGDKVPDYINMVDVLVSANPELKLLFIERDPRPIVNSALEYRERALLQFVVPDPMAMALDVCLRQQLARRVLAGVPDRSLIFRYQHFLQNPQEVFSQMNHFLAEDLASDVRAQAETGSPKDWKAMMSTEACAQVEAIVDLMAPSAYEEEPLRQTTSSCAMAEALYRIVKARGPEMRAEIERASGVFASSHRESFLACLSQYGLWMHMRNDWARAAEVFREFGPLFSKHPVLCFRVADFFFDIAEHSEAAKNYQSVLEHCPREPYFAAFRAKAFCQLGRIAERVGQHKEAVEHYGQSLATYPKFVQSRICLERLQRQAI